MAGKLKPTENIEEIPQFKPLGKIGGKGKGWKALLQSNAAKAGAVGVLVLLLAMVVAWQLIFSGSGATRQAARTTTNPPHDATPPTPPPMPQASEAATPAAPEQGDSSASEQSNQAAPAGGGEAKPADQGEAAQAEQAQSGDNQPGTSAHGGADASTQTPLPDDVSKWGKADFARARQENNPKLLDAVRYLGDTFPGSVPVAQGLADMLKPPKPADPNSAYPQAAYSVPGLVETTVYALGKNGSPSARQTLMQILTGKFATDDDRTAVEAVLKTLMQLPSPENEDIVLKVLTSPEDVRPAAVMQQGALQPGELRAKALELVKLYGAESLLKRLAEHLVQKGAEPNDPIATFLLEDNPANLGAQLVLYQSEDLSPDAKTKLEQSFLNYSSQAIAMMMGIPIATDGSTSSAIGSPWPTGAPSTREMSPSGLGTPNAAQAAVDAARAKMTDYERGAQLAKLLWGEPLASVMVERLGDVRSLERSAPEIMLASTLPLDSIHAAMYRMLKKRGSDGPQPLETAGWTDHVLNDPALLVIVKILMSTRSKLMKTAPIAGAGGATATARTGSGRYPPRRPTMPDAGYPTGGLPTRSEAAARKEQVETEWLNTMAKMVETWCTRLEAAAQAQKRAARRGQKVLEAPPARLDEFDFQDAKDLKDAKITAASQLNWPDKAPEGLGSVKPGTLKIQYFRLGLNGMPKKTMTAMKRLAKGGDIHDLPTGQWLEIIKNSAKPAGKRSVDILVTSADKQPVDLSTPKEEVIDLDVDILAIEIADPSKE